jgi:hypothetical protein
MSCLSFSLIPPIYLDWYRAVFEEGKRTPPPQNVRQQIVVQTAPLPLHSAPTSGEFVITKVREFDSHILSHEGSITITEKSVYFEGRGYPRPPFDLKVVISPRQRHLIAAYVDSSGLKFCDLTRGTALETHVEAEEIAVSGGQLFVKQADSIFAVDFIEVPDRILVSIKPIANVMMRATQMFEGLAIQNLLGATYASIVAKGDRAYQVRLPELDGHQIVNARLERNVLIVVIVRNGRYDKLVFRFSKQFADYDVRVISDVSATDTEFTVLDSGIVLHLTDENRLEVFSSGVGATAIRAIDDPALEGDIRLFHSGTQALIARGAELYRIQLRG